MIDVNVEADTATVHVVSGALDVTYELRPSELFKRGSSHYSYEYVRTGNHGYVFDLVGAVRNPRIQQPYIFGCLDFETAVLRAMRKARHLERVWRKTRIREAVAA